MKNFIDEGLENDEEHSLLKFVKNCSKEFDFGCKFENNKKK